MNRIWLLIAAFLGLAANRETRTVHEPYMPRVTKPVKKERINIPIHVEKNRLRHEKHWMMKYNLGLQGLIWHNGKVYWETRQLAEAHQ